MPASQRDPAYVCAIAPEFDLPKRFRKPNPVFARGEMTRVALTVLCEAGEPLPIRVIAVRALAAKGVTLPGPGTMKTTRVRLQQFLGQLDRRGITRKVGRGNSTRRVLA